MTRPMRRRRPTTPSRNPDRHASTSGGCTVGQDLAFARDWRVHRLSFREQAGCSCAWLAAHVSKGFGKRKARWQWEGGLALMCVWRVASFVWRLTGYFPVMLGAACQTRGQKTALEKAIRLPGREINEHTLGEYLSVLVAQRGAPNATVTQASKWNVMGLHERERIKGGGGGHRLTLPPGNASHTFRC